MEQNHVIMEVKDLEVGFGPSGFRLHPIQFTVDEGEIISIVGESGSGKSTLAKALVHLNAENAQVKGSVVINGKDIYAVKKSELLEMRMRDFSIAFQNSRDLLNPLMKIGPQLFEVLAKKYDHKEHLQRAKDLLELVGLEESVLHQYPRELSGGMIQRVLIVTAIALHPKLVILDEPTSSLDVHSKEKIVELIRQINQKLGIAFLIITHDFSLAQETSRRMMIFYQGHLVETGNTEDILDTPLHPYTRGLIHSSMDIHLYRDVWGIRNVVDGTVERSNGCPFYQRCHQHLDNCKETMPVLKPHAQCQNRWIACNRGGIVTVIEAKAIGKKFGKHTVLNSVNVKVFSSEVLSLVGVSGSGKSTLSSILAGYQEADQGELFFDGQKADYRKLHTIQHGLQMIFQDPETAINQKLTVLDAMMEPVKLNFKDRDLKAEAKQLLFDVGLPPNDDFLQRTMETLSGGQKQRILVARALSMEPKLLIADEVTSMLDASSKANLIRLLKGIQNQRGLSMLFVTHDLSCAMKISDRIYRIHPGGTVERVRDGNLLGVGETPEHEFPESGTG